MKPSSWPSLNFITCLIMKCFMVVLLLVPRVMGMQENTNMHKKQFVPHGRGEKDEYVA